MIVVAASSLLYVGRRVSARRTSGETSGLANHGGDKPSTFDAAM